MVGNKILKKFENSFPNYCLLTTLETTFKITCEFSKKTDKGIITIKYIPDKWLLEYYSFRKLVKSYKKSYCTYEKLATTIFQQIKDFLKPKYLVVTLSDPKGLKVTLDVFEEVKI